METLNDFEQELQRYKGNTRNWELQDTLFLSKKCIGVALFVEAISNPDTCSDGCNSGIQWYTGTKRVVIFENFSSTLIVRTEITKKGEINLNTLKNQNVSIDRWVKEYVMISSYEH